MATRRNWSRPIHRRSGKICVDNENGETRYDPPLTKAEYRQLDRQYKKKREHKSFSEFIDIKDVISNLERLRAERLAREKKE